MPRTLNHRRLLRHTTVALSLCFIATLSQFAIAQTVAPEPDPFAASDPFTKSNPKQQTPAFEPTKKLLRSSPPKTLSNNPPSLTQLRVLQLGDSKPGSPIASIPSDPYMTAEQEARIVAVLQVHDDTDWDGISLSELKRILKNHVPIWINRNALSIVGMDMDDVLENSGDVVAGPLGDRLACLFAVASSDTELGFAIRANRLEISSVEELHSSPITRIYDVTPLVLRIRGGKRVFDFETLSKLIQSTIDPDSWLAAGGCNVISDFIVGEPGAERSLIVVSAPSSVQLQLQPLLDRLNITTPKAR